LLQWTTTLEKETIMKRSYKLAAGIAAALGLGLGAAGVIAHPGAMGQGMMHRMEHGMMQGMGPGMTHGGRMAAGVQHDDAFRADMGLVHDMLANHESIKRTVTNLPNGTRTVTESDDPTVAQAIKAHVASMEQRLRDGREFNLFSPTIPVLFENREKLKTTVEATDKGIVFVQTSDDQEVVAALQAHAEEVSELARDGMAAMMRGMRSRMMGSAQR